MGAYNSEELKERSDKKKDHLNNLKQKIDSVKSHHGPDVAEMCDKFYAQVKKLYDQKWELIAANITKDELIINAKAALKKYKQEFIIEGLLKPHLESSMGTRDFPFNPASMRVHMLDPERCWKLGYLAITYADVEEAVKLINIDGIPLKKREEKIAEIEKEITRIENLVFQKIEEIEKTHSSIRNTFETDFKKGGKIAS
ncbi:MAG: hypothetical protein WCQ99_09790 [Pseudomonadota bacterium]